MLYRVAVFVHGEQNPSYNGLCYRHEEDAIWSAKDLMSRWTMMRDFRIDAITEDEATELKLTIRGEALIRGAGHRVQL